MSIKMIVTDLDHTLLNNKRTINCGIKSEISKQIIADILKLNQSIELAVEAEDNMYANYDATKYWKGINFEKINLQMATFEYVDKILVTTLDKNEVKNIRRLIPNTCYFELSKENIGMIMNREATKINAIKKVCSEMKVTLDEVIAFGDDENDLEMMKHCGIGIAVDNAIGRVKQVADYICENNNNDGPAKWILQNLTFMK